MLTLAQWCGVVVSREFAEEREADKRGKSLKMTMSQLLAGELSRGPACQGVAAATTTTPASQPQGQFWPRSSSFVARLASVLGMYGDMVPWVRDLRTIRLFRGPPFPYCFRPPASPLSPDVPNFPHAVHGCYFVVFSAVVALFSEPAAKAKWPARQVGTLAIPGTDVVIRTPTPAETCEHQMTLSTLSRHHSLFALRDLYVQRGSLRKVPSDVDEAALGSIAPIHIQDQEIYIY